MMMSLDSIKNYVCELGNLFLKNTPSFFKVTISFQGEQQLYIRLNRSKIRQPILVNYGNYTVYLIYEQKTIVCEKTLTWNLTKDLEDFKALWLSKLELFKSLDSQSQLIDIVDWGNSNTESFSQSHPDPEKIVSYLNQIEVDCVGLLASGSQWKCFLNHLGVTHWFLSESHFFDYSLYIFDHQKKPRTLKSIYYARHWDQNEFEAQVNQLVKNLSVYEKETKTISKGNYAVYLSPKAVAEILHLSWGSFSYYAYKQGDSPLRKLINQEVQLSPQINLFHSLELNLSPRFNDFGEFQPSQLTLINNGVIKELLISSLTAKKYGVTSNFSASDYLGREYPQVLVLNNGDIPEEQITKTLENGLWINEFHYCNWSHQENAKFTGMTRFGCFEIKKGQLAHPIEDVRFDVSLYDIWGSCLIGLTETSMVFPNTNTYFLRQYGGVKTPGMLIKNFTIV